MGKQRTFHYAERREKTSIGKHDCLKETGAQEVGRGDEGEGSGAGKVTKRSCYWCSWVVTAGGNEMNLYCRQGTMGLIIHHSGVVRVGGNDMQLYCRRWTAGLVIHHYCVVTGCRSNWRWDYFLKSDPGMAMMELFYRRITSQSHCFQFILVIKSVTRMIRRGHAGTWLERDMFQEP